MPVTDQQLAALRAYVTGDIEEHRRLLRQLGDSDKAAWSALVPAAFCVLVERRFVPNGSRADVIEFVGGVRARSERIAENLDPQIAERLILAVYTDEDTDEDTDDIDARVQFGAELVLLAGLVVDAQLDEAGVDGVLGDARKLADQWLA